MDRVVCIVCIFFFKQKTAYERRISDWSSDVCSSDLDYAHYARGARAKLEAFVASPVPMRPIPCADCSLCRWADHCDAVFTSQDSLFQVANITRGQVKKLEASGIETMAALARHDGPDRKDVVSGTSGSVRVDTV